MTLERFALLSLNCTITCVASVASVSRYRWHVTSAAGTTTGLWLGLSAGVSVSYIPPPTPNFPNPTKTQTTIPLTPAQVLTVLLEVAAANYPAVSAVVEIQDPTLFTVSAVTVEIDDFRFASPPLPTIDGSGLFVPPLPPPPPSSGFAQWSSEGTRPRAVQSRAQSVSGGKNYG